MGDGLRFVPLIEWGLYDSQVEQQPESIVIEVAHPVPDSSSVSWPLSSTPAPARHWQSMSFSSEASPDEPGGPESCRSPGPVAGSEDEKLGGTNPGSTDRRSGRGSDSGNRHGEESIGFGLTSSAAAGACGTKSL